MAFDILASSRCFGPFNAFRADVGTTRFGALVGVAKVAEECPESGLPTRVVLMIDGMPGEAPAALLARTKLMCENTREWAAHAIGA